MSSDIFQAIGQRVGAYIWGRPEVKPLREPIEQVFQTAQFTTFTREAFEQFAERHRAALPQFMDAAFINEGPVQEALARYIVEGQAVDVDELLRRYRAYIGAEGDLTRAAWAGYMAQLRETFATHPDYGPILVARDLKGMVVMLHDLHSEVSGMAALLDQLLKQPDIKAVFERRTGTHVFLSYSRKNARQAGHIRTAMEAAGHVVWQDVSAIKGGDQWLDAIDNGIKRAYAMVLVLSEQSWDSFWVKEEFLHAQRHKRLIIPIKVDDIDTPFGMNQLNPIAAKADLDTAVSHLVAALPTPPADPDAVDTTPTDRRQLELDYLNRLLLDYSVWKNLYTPMEGVATLRGKADTPDKPQVMTGAATIESKFRARIKQSPLAHPEPAAPPIEKEYHDILEAVRDLKHLAVLGDPGAGKTTTLWRITADYAQRAKDDPAAALPVLVNLGAIGATQAVIDHIKAQMGPLAAYYDALMSEQRLALLLDALNEMPRDGRGDHAVQLKAIMEQFHQGAMTAVVTCRELDYVGDLDLGIPQKVVIAPLDPVRIHQFIKGYVVSPPDAADKLFWELAGNYAQEQWAEFQYAVGDYLTTFWLATELLDGLHWSSGGRMYNGIIEHNNEYWEHWLGNREQPRSMLQLATNPFMLYMITQVFAEEGGALPPNRGGLFALFVDFLLLDREKLAEADAEAVKQQLANLAYLMQQAGEEGTTFSEVAALEHIAQQTLYHARSASLVGGSGEVRFTHQLLQEYFAALKLKNLIDEGYPASAIWPAEQWWEPTGWEETAILLAGLYRHNCTPVLTWLQDANPELAARCAVESGAETPDTTKAVLQQHWVPRMDDIETDPHPHARAAIGRGVGLLNLDNRRGVGLNAAGLPDVDWVEIPAGEFIHGDDDKSEYPYWGFPADRQTLHLPTFYMSRYPITYVQFEVFVQAADGFTDVRWWQGFADDEDRRQSQVKAGEQEFKYWNHPRENVSWYDAMAFCRWWSWRLVVIHRGGSQTTALPLDGTLPVVTGIDWLNPLTWPVRLPTEFEWEKAARGTDGRIYSYGNKFDASKGNTEADIHMTSAVGIFPHGASPYGVRDMSGNVWEWCLTENRALSNDIVIFNNLPRAAHGGSWRGNRGYAQAAFRGSIIPRNRNDDVGFRVATSAPIIGTLVSRA